MSHITVNLKTFQSEQAAEESKQPLLCLRRRCKGMMVNACAHAVFFCKLLCVLRQKEDRGKVSLISSKESMGSESLKVGIIGGGHIGKQLATDSHLLGIPFHNYWDWLDLNRDPSNEELTSYYWPPEHPVLFLVSIILKDMEVTLSKLKQLLSYSAILRPQYQCNSRDLENVGGTNGTVRAALQDPIVIQATCPCNSKERIAVTGKWLEVVFYAALNSCMWRRLPHQQALKLLNDVCFPEHCPICAEKTSCPRFVCGNFVNQTFVSSPD